MSGEIEKFFNKLVVIPIGTVDISIGNDIFNINRGPYARFMCISCQCELLTKSEHNRYECGSCGVEISNKEAIELCDSFILKIRMLSREAGKRRTFMDRLFRRS
jgi:hypothetical protein